MPSKLSKVKYLIVINLPYRVGPEPLPKINTWWGILTPWKDRNHWRSPAWLQELPRTPFLLAAAAAPGFGILLEKKNSNN